MQAQAEVDASLVSCYCAQLAATNLFSDTLCQEWIKSRSVSLTLQNLSAVVVPTINMLLPMIMKKLTAFEAHHDLDTQNTALALRLFIAQFINTGLLTLLVNAYLPAIPGSTGQYADFSARWFFTVGSSLLVTMLLNMFSLHVAPLSRLALQWVCMRRSPRTAKSQTDLNQRFTGPDFHLSVRYAAMLNTLTGRLPLHWQSLPRNLNTTCVDAHTTAPTRVHLCFAVTLLYCAGLPLLLPIACVAMIIMYWVDKFLFLRHYRYVSLCFAHARAIRITHTAASLEAALRRRAPIDAL
ncbi:hypothetical protein EON66_02735 [archaeon]|nr:MAG: hypothetical protein EON66_02735 [archaeon]